VPKEKAGIPVDEQFGAAVLRDAAAEATRQRRAEKATRELAVGEIARRYREFVDIFATGTRRMKV
jgi:hypothetical protein